MMVSEVKGPKYWVERALKSAGSTELDMMGFIEATGFPIDTEVANKFYVQLRHNEYIYLGEYEIEFFGYKGPLWKQKEKIMTMLNAEPYASEKGTSWHVYDNKKYSEFFDSLTRESNRTPYPPVQTGRGHGKELHVLISPRIYKHLCMKADTTRGYQIRDYMVKVDELVTTMLDYMRVLGSRKHKVVVKKKDSEISDLKLMMIDMEQKAEERSQKAEERHNKLMDRTETIQESLEESKDEILEKIVELAETKQDLTNVAKDRVATKRVPKDRYNHIVILKDDDCTEDEPPYYILRTQEKSITSRIATLKKKYPAIKEIFRIYTPNATSAWISICDKYKPNISKSVTPNWFFLTNTTEARFKSNLMKMDTTERQNPKFI